jgi:hypothetical protein
VPDDSAPLPAIICHYAAILRSWAYAAPETSVHGNRAELQLSLGSKIFAAIFGCRKKNWSLRRIEVRRGEETATFARGEDGHSLSKPRSA